MINFYKSLLNLPIHSFRAYIIQGISGSSSQKQDLKNQQAYFCRKVNKIYYNAYKRLQYYLKYSFLYNLTKATASLIILLIILYEWYYDDWIFPYHLIINMIISICLDCVKIVYNLLMLKKMKVLNIFLDIAEILGYCKIIYNYMKLPYEEIPYNIQTSVQEYQIYFGQERLLKKIEILRAIKFQYTKRFKSLKILNISSYILYQGAGIFMFYLLFKAYQMEELNQILIFIYVLVTALLYFFQYINLFFMIYLEIISIILVIIFVPLSFPFLVIYQIYSIIRDKIKIMIRNKAMKAFAPKKFKIKQYEMEISCVICWEKIIDKSMIVQLPCNKMHIFHQQCIQQWWKNLSYTCPICRSNFREMLAPNNYDQDQDFFHQ